MINTDRIVNIIGAGLAGCECAYKLANNGVKVNLYEMKKNKKTQAQNLDTYAELVCSNSLKSDSITNACGLLKKEMNILGSLMIDTSNECRVEAGQALAVDREKFSKIITDKILNHPNISVFDKEIENINELEGIVVCATGPLTSDKLSDSIQSLVGEDKLYFYDAVAPIIDADSINMNIAYKLDRYGTEEGDYINLPMNKEQYQFFYNELINAKSADRHDFDKLLLFEGCMPIEEMAKRGEKTLTFGMLKPVGLDNPKTLEKYYAVVQLRSENIDKTSYNMVGFQTSLKFSEQERVFKLIPGLENAIFLRYGVMHKNTYINGSKLLDKNFKLKNNKQDIYFAGQISGVEGYVESAASGLIVALSILGKFDKKEIHFNESTMLGSLSKYVSTENKDYQPMNANFGIIKPLEVRIKDKKEKYTKLANLAISNIEEFKLKNSYK